MANISKIRIDGVTFGIKDANAQRVINYSQRVDADYINDINSTNKFVTQTEKQKLAELENYDDSGVRSEIALNRKTLGTICKNLMEVTATSRTFNGVTFTVNDNGSITVNGTATERADFNICQSVEYHSGQILTGCPKNGSAETYCLAIYTAGRDTGDGLILSSDGAHECYIRIEKGYTANNLVFFPMLRDGNIADDTFEPYHPSLQTQVGRLVDSGAKNILNLGDTYFVSTDVTYTFDGDSGTVNASKTTGTYKRIVWQLPTETGKKYKVSFDVTAIARSAMIFPTNVSSAGSAPWGQIDVTENGHYSMYFTPAADDVWFVLYLSTSEGTDEIEIENLMVCTAEDYEASPEFAPYVPTNQELYKKILTCKTEVDSDVKPNIALALQTLGTVSKNLLENTASSQTINGVTFTVNPDDSVTAQGTASERVQFILQNFTTEQIIPTHYYRLSGSPNQTGISLRMQLNQAPWTVYANDSGEGAYNSQIPADTPIMVYINIAVGTEVSATFYPMLRLADITDDTFEKYQPSLQKQIDELKARITALED